ncbi:MAG TPA: hypothetical protein VJM31_13080 [Vicinamibacterales bacterium]|nr:hypothetical protein [Vicinamibacterales bacterium]
MNDYDIDRLIDTAAGQMIAREPERPLRPVVMASIREADAPAPRRWIWATAAVAAVFNAAIAVGVWNRAPVPVPLPSVPARPTADRALARAPVWVYSTPQAPTTGSSVGGQSPSPVRLPPADPFAIEALEAEPIVFSAIDLPPLENETVSIAAIELSDLTIEPLAASND